MKKSTLITTIAMIVVVVVALSTATYAWFTSSSVSVAKVTISTEATGDWMIFEGKDKESKGEYTFTTAAAEAIDLTATMLQKGLASPTASYTHAMELSGTTAKVTSQSFIAATKSGETVTAGSAPTAIAPYVLKVSNASGSQKSLRVSVIINAGPSQTVGTLYAAAATVTDIRYKTTVSGSLVQTVNTAYYKANEGATDIKSGALNVTQNKTAVTANGFTTKPKDGFSYENATSMKSATEYTYFDKSSGDTSLGLGDGDWYLTYSFDIVNLQASDSVYFSIYTWIDGWVADTSAQKAEYKVCYAFTSVPTEQR